MRARIFHMKKCARCGEKKTFDKFWKTVRKNGYSARCKECHGLGIRTCIVCRASFLGKNSTKMCSQECKEKHRPQTFIICQNCGVRYGPVDHLSRRFCSYVCKCAAQTLAPDKRKPRHVATAQAGRAQRRIAYLLSIGKITRPSKCNECGCACKPEGAHYNYHEPERVRWLCRSCHVKWDKADPKGGTQQQEAGAYNSQR